MCKHIHKLIYIYMHIYIYTNIRGHAGFVDVIKHRSLGRGRGTNSAKQTAEPQTLNPKLQYKPKLLQPSWSRYNMRYILFTFFQTSYSIYFRMAVNMYPLSRSRTLVDAGKMLLNDDKARIFRLTRIQDLHDVWVVQPAKHQWRHDPHLSDIKKAFEDQKLLTDREDPKREPRNPEIQLLVPEAP